MGQSLKAILQLFTLAGVIASIIFWAVVRHPDAFIWLMRFSLPAGTIGLLLILWKAETREDKAPDLLRKSFGRPFERNGFTFVPAVCLENGVSVWNIHFQNRYARACRAEIVLEPSQKRFSFRRHKLPKVTAEVECPGAAVGIARIPYALPPEYEGRSIRYDVSASVKYPDGGGKLVRFREGIAVAEPTSDAREAVKTFGFLLLGVIRFSRPARIKLTLPSGVHGRPSPDGGADIIILWPPDAEAVGSGSKQ